MTKYYLAVDIGASSGRHMLASMEEGRMKLEEVYRFPNGMEKKNGSLCWNVDRLFTEIKNGLKKCKEVGKIPSYMGIDTWGVDYVLLDQVQTLLMIPDYFHFLLTGVKKNEYTNATTGQLVNPLTNDWDYDLMEMLGYKKSLFRPLSMPGTLVGSFTREVQREVGFDCQVLLPATHDTGSAVLAVPTNDDRAIYISSGTWSLMGIERKEADCFLAPDSMIQAVQNYCRESGQQVPQTVGEIAAVIYNSLAKCYRDTIAEIEELTGQTYSTIYVVGGGSNAGYLNELTARYTGRKVSAGPSEATAIGNIAVQMLYDGVFANLQEARACIGQSFDVKIYEGTRGCR